MREAEKVRQYFDVASVAFDSLYSENEQKPFMRFVNRTFRKDIYGRFLLSMNYIIDTGMGSALDVGCGSGRYAYALAKAGIKRIVALDMSSKMIELARRNTSDIDTNFVSCNFVCSDFMNFETSERFDVVLAMGVFDYVAEPVVFLRKMKSLANHSVIVSFPSRSFYRTPLRKVRYYFKNCPLHFYDRHSIARLGLESGFSDTCMVKIKGSGMDYFVVFRK
ncbi:MAG: class I SAM-dependent methyltransferase [Syntrophobacteraceae bacterium]|jgi:2-polyprenyl-3-methyl-5-hydroxy-6-metoxy-1,4-benzoquinol methylase